MQPGEGKDIWGLQAGAGAVEPGVLAGGGHELDAHGQPVLGGEAAGDGDRGDPGQVGGDGGDRLWGGQGYVAREVSFLLRRCPCRSFCLLKR